MTDPYSHKLQELSKLVRDEINIIENGGKLSSFKHDPKPREKELKNELKTVCHVPIR
jgi:predicted house-cleaning noncanonical NTP pyrophosphatase (MazG superfamily)